MICPKCQTEHPNDTDKCLICSHDFMKTPDATVQLSDSMPKQKREKITAASSEISYEKLKSGFSLGNRYLILEKIGTGGMGKVYKALDKEVNEIVALKIIRPVLASDSEAVERFKNEMKIARKITHKNVCRIYQFEEIEGIKCISMEFISGEDLKNFIKRAGQLPLDKSLQIIMQVCNGLKEAHSFGIIHQDLKPQNIMINSEARALIMDFGIARFKESQKDQKTGMIMGTPEYISPEQVEGKEPDHRADIYSLGIILYELITGKTPFSSDTPLSLAIMHVREQPRDPREINSKLPESLAKVTLKCLEKDKEKRYKSIDELLVSLEKELHLSKEEMEARAKEGFFGNLKILPIDEIVKILFNSKKTGILHLSYKKERIDLFFNKGEIFRANSENPAHKIGQFLLRRNKVTQDDIELCLKVQKKVDDKFCQILRNLKLISKADVEEIMRLQFGEMIFDILKWGGGHFDFEETTFDEEDLNQKDVDIFHITSEIIEKTKLWRGWLSELPPEDALLFSSKSNIDEQEIKITSEIKEVISLANGENTINDILQISSCGKFLTAKTIHELFKKNILLRLGAKGKVEEAAGKPAQSSEISILLKMIKNIYSICFSEINDKLTKKLGPKSEELLIKILKKVAKSYDLVFDSSDIKGLSSFEFDAFFSKAGRIPEESTRIHNILSLLNDLLQEKIKLISNMLGQKTKKETIDSIKNKINPLLKKNIYLSEKYGLAPDLKRLLKY